MPDIEEEEKSPIRDPTPSSTSSEDSPKESATLQRSGPTESLFLEEGTQSPEIKEDLDTDSHEKYLS